MRIYDIAVICIHAKSPTKQHSAHSAANCRNTVYYFKTDLVTDLL